MIKDVRRTEEFMLATRNMTPFVGRQRELAALREELAAARGGQPRLVLLEGPSGIGKSELIERFLDEETELTVLRATGEQWEALVAYGVADQLMRVAGVGTARLLAGRERSLPPEEPVGVGGRILEIIENLELKAPVVMVLDDAHWADVDSLRALLFVARRLVGKRVLTLLVQQSDESDRLPEGLRRMATGRSGTAVRLQALTLDEVSRLATALGSPRLSTQAAEWLHTHTEGNPFQIATLVAELPPDSWCGCVPVFCAPRAFVTRVARRLVACSPPTRRLVEATAVLGANPPLASVTALAEVANLVDAIDEAADLNLLRISDETGISRVRFSHPLVQPAVYQLLGPARRTRLHAGAAAIVEDEATVLRHRAMASIQPNAGLANELETYARHESTVGAWVHAAWALAEGSRLSPGRRQRQLRLLRAVAAMISAGDLIQAEAFAREAAAFAPGPLRDSTVGYLAMLHGRASEAEQLLHAAWEQADPMGQPEIAAVVAQRLALHEVGRLRGREVVEWARRAVELSSAGDPIRVEAEALLGIGLGWLGRVPEGLANCESVLARLGGGHDGPPTAQVRVADGWLRLVADDVEGAQAELAQTAPAILRSGSTGNAMWAYVWLARTRFVAGAWDAAAADAERAVSLLEQSGLEWLGPLVRLTATLVPAARGEWAAAEEHAREATSQLGGYELMVLAAALARAHVASARDDHEAVLRALEPVVGMRVREGVDEPGYWLWQDLYADALVSSGRLAEAEAFLRTHEELATSRGRGSALGGLARARGRLEAAQGHLPEAEAAFRRGLLQLQSLPMPFQRALLELAFGKVLRRVGQRRAAADRLRAARERLVALRARPYLARCDQELAACGLAPGKRRASGPIRLTAQELAVARLVAVGMSNREVAAELFISIKTVQYHVTHIYAKLGVRSRAELAAQFRENELMNDASGPVEGPIQ